MRPAYRHHHLVGFCFGFVCTRILSADADRQVGRFRKFILQGFKIFIRHLFHLIPFFAFQIFGDRGAAGSRRHRRDRNRGNTQSVVERGFTFKRPGHQSADLRNIKYIYMEGTMFLVIFIRFKFYPRFEISADLVSTSGMHVLPGKDFDGNTASDNSGVIINQSLARVLGKGNPVGSVIQSPREQEEGKYETLRSEP